MNHREHKEKIKKESRIHKSEVGIPSAPRIAETTNRTNSTNTEKNRFYFSH